MILDGAAVSRAMFGQVLDPREHLARCYPNTPVAIPPLDHVVATATPMVARVTNGIWVALCDCGARGIPSPGCVVFLDHLLGWCLRCQNAAYGRGWRPVIVPVPGMRHQIEAVLLCRPNVGDRNWDPRETIDDLIAQNREHGDPIPDLRAPIGPVLGPDWRQFVAAFSPLPRAANRAGRRLLRRWARGA